MTVRILISAFACLPDRGSEPGVGWRWSHQLHLQSNADVTVVTRDTYRDKIEYFITEDRAEFPKFEYVHCPDPFQKLGTAGHYLYYLAWQFALLLHLIKKGRWRQYDYMHHLTYGGIRQFSFLPFLPKPFICGPIGGGESPPLRIVAGLSTKARIKDFFRRTSNLFSYLDPLLILAQLRSIRIFAKTKETERLLWLCRSKTQVLQEIAVLNPPDRPHPGTPLGSPCLFYAGRLISWKGVDMLLDAIHILTNKGIAVSLAMAGEGPESERIATRVAKEGLSRVTLHGHVDFDRLRSLYRAADIFVFPSLHDSTGNVMAEAASFALPSICFDLGGPPIIGGKGAHIVSTKGANRAEAARRLADAIEKLTRDDDYRAQLSLAATLRAKELNWTNILRQAYEGIINIAPPTEPNRDEHNPKLAER